MTHTVTINLTIDSSEITEIHLSDGSIIEIVDIYETDSGEDMVVFNHWLTDGANRVEMPVSKFNPLTIGVEQ